MNECAYKIVALWLLNRQAAYVAQEVRCTVQLNCLRFFSNDERRQQAYLSVSETYVRGTDAFSLKRLIQSWVELLTEVELYELTLLLTGIREETPSREDLSRRLFL